MKKLLTLLLITTMISGCGETSDKGTLSTKGQSPSSRWSMTTVEVPNPTNPDLNLAKVVISDFEGQVVYEDRETAFRTYYKLNTAWDEADRLWAYYGADQSVYFWQLENDHWQKRKWGKARKTLVYDDLTPPDSIYDS